MPGRRGRQNGGWHPNQGYPCSGQWNQTFTYHSDGTIRLRGKCVDAAGGQGRDGDQLVLWTCHNGANQRWRAVNGQLVGINRKCMDLKGGSGHWLGNQPPILWTCNRQINQLWMAASNRPPAMVPLPSGIKRWEDMTQREKEALMKAVLAGQQTPIDPWMIIRTTIGPPIYVLQAVR